MTEKKENEAEQQQNWSKMIEERLQGLDAAMKQCGNTIAGLQGSDVSILQSLPSRLAALEEKSQPRKAEGSSDSAMDSSDEPLQNKIEALLMDFSEQTERSNRFEEQIKELRTRMQETAKAHSMDIDSLQKICRNLRADFEMRPILDMPSVQGNTQEAGIGDYKLEAALTELQNRVQRKADNDTVEQLVRSTANAKEGIDRIKATIDDLKQQVRLLSGGSRRGSSSIQEPQVDLESDFRRGSLLGFQSDAMKNTNAELLDSRVKILEGELVSLATQLTGKADRKDLDGLQIQMTLLGQVQPEEIYTEEESIKKHVEKPLNQEHSREEKGEGKGSEGINQQQENEDTHSVQSEEKQDSNSDPGNHLQIRRSSDSSFQTAFQKLQEIISKKADRDELLQLHEMIHLQRAEHPQLQSGNPADLENLQQKYKDLIDEVEGMSAKMKDLEERSDLSVLISKRLENFAQPAATIQESPRGYDEVQSAINEHAERMMEYADTLLQMEALLATKADASGLQALRASILDLQQRRQRGASIKLATTNGPILKQEEIPAEIKIEKHDKMFSQLMEDVELLRKAILTLSGHDMHSTHPYILRESDGVIDPNLKSGSNEMNVDQGVVALDSSRPVTPGKKSVVTFGKVESFSGSGGEAEIRDVEEVQRSGDAKKLQDTQSSVYQGDVQGTPESQIRSHDVFRDLEEALNTNKIRPKGDADVVARLAEELLPIALKMKEMDNTLSHIQDNKAEKGDLQKVKNYVKHRLDRAETAMFSGRALPGFKCMSCDHQLGKLNPNRADFLPTNCMPPQVLPMHAAERLYSHKDDEGPESPKAPLGGNNASWENQNKNVTSPMQTPAPQFDGSRFSSPAKPKQGKKK